MKNLYFKKLHLVVYVLLFAGLAITSCQESATNIFDQNSNISTMSVNQQNAFKGKKGTPPGLIPNSKKYADNSLPSASGRDGEVTVTSRALIDAEGNVDLEVTTGELDSDESAPGTITKLQVKALDTDSPDKDNPEWTENYNKLRDGGSFTTSYNGLERGQELFVHANVKGIKKKGTAVVFMYETIKARPDIQVTEVGANANEVLVDDLVTITAALSEGNGDVGATTSCVLYVDGDEVDRADNVWVDAGYTVGCQFTTSFAEVGEKNIIVAAEDVLPGDYDTGNNSAYTTVTVVEPETGGPNGFNWYGSVFMSSDYYTERRFSATHVEKTESSMYLIFFNGSKEEPADFVMPDNFSATVSTNGETAFDVDLELRNGRYSNWESGLQASIYTSTWNGNKLNFNFSIYTYKYIYYGSNDTGGDFYSERISGPQFQLGEDISFNFEFGGHTASGSFPINTYSSEYRQDYGVNNYYLSRYTSYNGWGSGQPE